MIAQLIGINSLDKNEGLTDRAVLDHLCNKLKGKRKGTNGQLNQPTSSSIKVKKLAWTPKTIEVLLKYYKYYKYKTKGEFNGIDYQGAFILSENENLNCHISNFVFFYFCQRTKLMSFTLIFK